MELFYRCFKLSDKKILVSMFMHFYAISLVHVSRRMKATCRHVHDFYSIVMKTFLCQNNLINQCSALLKYTISHANNSNNGYKLCLADTLKNFTTKYMGDRSLNPKPQEVIIYPLPFCLIIIIKL